MMPRGSGANQDPSLKPLVYPGSRDQVARKMIGIAVRPLLSHWLTKGIVLTHGHFYIAVVTSLLKCMQLFSANSILEILEKKKQHNASRRYWACDRTPSLLLF